jgi:F0F1-type ATP synthase membrane subunit b/b'
MANAGADQTNRTDTGPRDTGSATEETKQKAEHLTKRVKEKTADLKRKAEETASDMGARARSVATDQKNAAAHRMEGVAHALRRASDDLRDQGQPMVAEYSRHVAEGLESFADSLGKRDVDELVEGVEDFARTRPVAFLGGAAVAGFALARFMKSSAARRQRSQPRPATTGVAATPAGGTTAAGTWPPGTPAGPASGAAGGVATGGTPLAGGYGEGEEGAL